jgi:hypothetical protein
MKRNTFLSTAVAVMLFATGISAQTTGSIDGAIVDENRAPLPSVTVEATSPSLQGTKVAVSDKGGKFHFVFMPPGIYTVKCTRQGFTTVEQPNISVELGRAVTLNVQMRSAFKEEVVVSGTTPILDVRSTEIGTSIRPDAFLALPMARNYINMAQITPGTQTDATGTTVYGSTGSENAYYIDGINTTAALYGQQGKSLNFEFIQEMQVKTGGYQAEFGRATGGTINVITKSGGNDFHGDAFGYDDRDSRESNLSKDVRAISSTLGRSWVQSGYVRNDYGADVGGYVMKDQIWFFGAYDYVKNTSDHQVAADFTRFGGTNYGFPTAGQIFPDVTTQNLWSGKLTWRITPNQSLIASAFGDPTKEDGPVGPTLAGNLGAIMGTDDTGGADYTAKYEGVLGEKWVLNGQFAAHHEKDVPGGAGFSDVALLDYTHPLYRQSGVIPQWDGWGYSTKNHFGRDVYRGDLSYFLGNWGGDHEFKFGVEQEHITVDVENLNSGGQRIYQFCGPGGYDAQGNCTDIYYRHRFYMNRLPPLDPATGRADPNLIDSTYMTQQVVKSKNNNYAAYLQDSWKMGSNLTLNLGLRWERQQMYHSDGTVAADLKKNWAPRLGFVWDPSNTGASKIYGSYGYFYETIPMDMVIRSFGGEIDAFLYNRHGAENDPNRLDVIPDPAVNTFRPNSIVGTPIVPVDPNLKGQYIEEAILGGDHEVGRNWVVGGKLIYRNLARVIEDALTTTGGYYIGNPGEGIQKVDFDMNYAGPYPTVPAKRTFKGIEIDVTKRFSNNWSLFVSYLYSKLEGNYDGTFQSSTGQLDPNNNSAYDYAEFQVNNSGFLSNDRRHQVKVNATYSFGFGLNVGLSAYYRSGTPITAMGYSYNYQNWEYYLSKRGAFGTTPGEYEADLHLGYPLKFSGMQVSFLVDVFNLLNRQGVTGVNMRYDLVEDYGVINYAADGTSPGTFVPPIKPGDTNKPPTNPAFGTANAWQDPRSIRLGVRLTF